MAEKKYVVRLSLEERSFLEEFLGKGRRSAELVTRARILLKADVSEAGDGWTDDQIVEALDTSKSNVSRTRQRLVETGLEDCMSRSYNPKSARPMTFDGEAEARLIALTCSAPPKVMQSGRCACWRRRSSNSRSSNAPATARSGGR